MQRQEIDCALLDGALISEAECCDVCLVAEEMITPSAISQKYTAKNNYKEICLNCKHHSDDE